MKEVIKKLNRLAEIKDVCESFQEELGDLIERAFLHNPNLKERYIEVSQELELLTKRRLGLVEEISKAVLEKKESVKGERLQAIFSKGKTTWNTKALEGYAIAHPEVNQLKKTGQPSVSIRESKEKEIDLKEEQNER